MFTIFIYYNILAIIRDYWCYNLLIIRACCCLQLLSNNQINKYIKFHSHSVFSVNCSYSWNYEKSLILWFLNQDSDSLILNIIFWCWVCKKMRLHSWWASKRLVINKDYINDLSAWCCWASYLAFWRRLKSEYHSLSRIINWFFFW